MIFKLSDLRKTFLYFVQGPKFYGGGAPSGQSTVTNQATIPDELKPYISTYMGAAEKQLYQKNAEGEVTGFQPYRAYGATFDEQGNQIGYDPSKGVSEFDNMQIQAYNTARGLSTGNTFGTAKESAEAAGRGMFNSAGTALGYGAQGQAVGQQGQAIGQLGQAIGQQGQGIGQQGANIGQLGQAIGQQGQGIGQQAFVGASSQAGSQIGQAGQFGSNAANIGSQAAASSANQAGSHIGQAGRFGAQGAGIGMAAAGQAGQGYSAQSNFANQITSPGTTAAYMSPYMQNVVNQQIGAANRQYDITGSQQMGQATKANAFGGSREALMAAENERARNTAIGDIQAKGLQEAFTTAQAQQQFGANLGIQGLNAGTSAMQAGIQGAQAGLQGVSAQTAASNMALQGAQTGIQGQQAGIQGVSAQTAASNMQLAGADRALTGNAQNLQGNQNALSGNAQNLQGNQQNLAGINTALQGVQGAQAGYTGLTQAAGALGNLSTQDLAAQQSIIKTQADLGAQARARDQAIKDQAMLDYANAQNKPMQDVGTMSNLVRGIGTGSNTQTQYAAQPSAISQIGGLAATGIGAYGALKANGGVIEDRGYANGGIVGYATGGSVEESMRNKLEDLDNPRLQEIIKSNESPEMTKIAKEVMRSNYAKGGIVAFAQGGQPAASWLSQLEGVSQEMKNKAYKLHGWTDEDVANYQSSKRVPLDPNKGLAQIPGESATINTNKEPVRSTRFTPEETAPYESSIETGKELSTKVKKQSKERMAWEAERAARDAAHASATESVPSATTPDPWAERSNTDVRGQLKKGYGAIKSGIASLATPENIAAAGSEINAQRFKEGLGSESTLSSVEQGILGGPSLAPELVKHLIEKGTGGSIGEQFRKASPGLASALDKFGDSASKRYEIIKNWATTPVGGNKGIDAVETPNLVEPKKIEPMSAPAPMGQMQNETQTQTARPAVPAQEGRNATSVMNQGTTVQANAPAQSEDSVLSRLQASRDSAQADANMSVEDRVKQQKALEEKFVGKDEETAAYRKSIMDERANAPDEARRQMSMRLMEFGANWASTPGAPLVAGMKALTSTLPAIMSDTKENKKMMKDLDKSEYLLNHATRLEELGHLKEASAAKDKASALVMKHEDALVTYGLAQQKIQSEEKIAKQAQFGATTRTAMEQEGRSDPRAVTPTGRLASIDKELADLSRDKTGSPNPAKFKYTQEQLDTIAKLKQERAELRGDRPQYQAPRPKDPERIRELGDEDTRSKLGLTGKP